MNSSTSGLMSKFNEMNFKADGGTNESRSQIEKIRLLIDECKTYPTWHLRGYELTDADVKVLANELETNTTCEMLDLQINRLTTAGAYHIAEMLKVNRTLKHLWLDENQIGDEGAQALFEVLKNNENKTLHVLGLSYNQLTDRSVDKIIETINGSQTLTGLNFDDNQISEINYERITKAGEESRKFPMEFGVTLD